MNIDQRLEALTERHEALAQFVELVGHQIQDHYKQLEIDGQHIRQLAMFVQTTNDNVNALLRVVESHERRLSDIDGVQ